MKRTKIKRTKIKRNKQITAAALTAALMITGAAPAYAGGVPGEKQEVIYVMADPSGRVKDIEVVNIFDSGDITDYGDYSNVKVLNTTDEITQNGDEIRISSAADKVYYQGTMNEKQIPWDISIRYFLDGKEYSASELAGKSGALEIRFAVSKNKKCKGSFYEDYALQASFTLDSDKCANLTAEGATLANVGSNKQISYTILPGKGIDAVIRADVTDFWMDAVSVNGIRLDLDVEIDEEELKGKVDDLIDAVKQLDDGALKLNDGTEELLDGSTQLKTGASSLHSGSAALDEGVLALQNGLYAVQGGINSLNAVSSTLTGGSSEVKAALNKLQTAVNSVSADEKELKALLEASGKIKKAISSLNTGAAALQANLGYAQYKAVMAQNGLSIDDLTAGNAGAVDIINGYKGVLDTVSQIPEYAEMAGKYGPALLSAADQIIGLLNANNAAFGGMESYLNGISGELPALTAGLTELNGQYEAFDTAIGGLVAGLGKMTGNLAALADGVNLLVANYENLDYGIESYTDGVAQVAAGFGQVMSGVSALAAGSKELVSGSGELYDGTAKLYDGVVSLCDGTKDMTDGTGEFRAETSNMKEKLEDEIDGILDTIGGSMENPVSFVSSKNTSVDSVQFVIKTTAIEKSEPVVVEREEPEESGFKQKLKELFEN